MTRFTTDHHHDADCGGDDGEDTGSLEDAAVGMDRVDTGDHDRERDQSPYNLSPIRIAQEQDRQGGQQVVEAIVAVFRITEH